MAERVRAGGSGIAAFYTPTGVNTLIETGGLKSVCGRIPKKSSCKESRVFDERKYVLETAIRGDVALVRAQKADKFGNLRFHRAARNFNPIMAAAADITIAEVEELVEELSPDDVHLPGIHVDYVIKADDDEKNIEKVIIDGGSELKLSSQKEKIARRVAEEFKNGMYVNLGIGMPTLSSRYSKANCIFQSENGILGMGGYPSSMQQVDPDVINAGKEAVVLTKGASIFGSDQSFAMIRGGHMDLTVLGGMEVGKKGDLANWIIPDKMVKGMGGAMDLVSSGKTKVIVAMEHTTKSGQAKILDECSLPLTGSCCVDMVITDLAVFDVVKGSHLVLIQLAKGTTVEEVQQKTGCSFDVKPKLLKPF